MDKQQVLQEYEAGVIGNLFNYYEQSQHVRSLLTPDDFSANFDYQNIYRLFLKAEGYNQFFDAVCAKGYHVAVSTAMDGYYASPWHLEYCTNMLIAATKAKKMRADIGKMLHEVADEDLPVMLMDYAGKVDVQGNKGDDNSQEQVAKVIAGLNCPDTENRILTGIPTLDNITGGLHRGNISVLGALPSSGKTALALTMAYISIKRCKRVVMFSLEMGVNQLWERLTANAADISYHEIERHRVGDMDIEKARVMLGACADYVKFYDNCLSVESMANKIIRHKPDLVIVDFLQYVQVGGQRFNTTADKLEYIINEFKRLARLPYNPPCHIMILSQHSRDKDNKESSIFTLKGSSGIEQGGDYIMLLDRPHVRDNREPEEKAMLTLGKNKFGRLAKVQLYFEGDRQRFRELAPDENYPVPPNLQFEEEKPW